MGGARSGGAGHDVCGVLGPAPFDLGGLMSLCARCHGELGREQQLAG
jgi:hypothetical protein